MKKTSWLSVIVFILCATTSCWQNQGNNTKQDDVPRISLRQGWFPWAGYAGELIAMYDLDSIHGVDFVIEPGADDIDPMKMVLSGSNDFGITSAEAIVTANEKGANLVVIGVVNYKSPTCFISLAENNIKSPYDFEGKKVGILTGSETETVYRTLVKKLNLDTKKITEVEAPYDLKTFINKAYDVYPGFIYSEPIALELQNIKYNLIKPEDYGVELIGAVYFTSRSMINKKPELVQAFVDIISAGWKEALENPEKAIEYLKKYDNSIDYQRELASLMKGKEYFAGEDNRVLYASDSSWMELNKALRELGKVGPDNDISKSFDNDFIVYHEKIRKNGL